MKKLKIIAVKTLIVLGVLGVIYGCFALDYKMWRLQHPEAPKWTYISTLR